MAGFVDYYRILDKESVMRDGVQIEFEDVNRLDEKLFISVGGINDSLKIPLIENNLSNFQLVEQANVVTSFRTLYFNVKSNESRLERLMCGKKSFVCMSSNVDLVETRQQFETAKENGFTTVMVLVESDKESRKVFDMLKSDKLVDFWIRK
jgi:hypothetical protein